MEMHGRTSKGSTNLLIKAFRTLFNKFVKNNDDYPVKYYKKNKHYPKMKDL